MQASILLVDDDKSMCELLCFILRGYNIVCVHTKADAVVQITREAFDLIILDSSLPDGKGLDICIFVRALNIATPILFCTTSDLVNERQAIKAGAQGFVNKGEVVENLETVVKELLLSQSPEAIGGRMSEAKPNLTCELLR